MRTRVFVYATVASLALASPRFAGAMGIGDDTTPPTVATPVVVPLTNGVAPANATLLLGCSAQDNSSVVSLTAAVYAGSDLTAPIFTSPNLVFAAGPSVSGSTTWTSPAIPGSYTLVCTATDDAFYAGTASANTSFSTESMALPPAVSAFSGPSQLVVGTSGSFSVSAVDPNAPPSPLTYTWTATGGIVTPNATNPAAATWTAPSAAGSYEIHVAVSNGTSTTEVTKAVNAVLAVYQGAFSSRFSAPRRLAAAASGALYVVSGRQQDPGEVGLLTARGDVRGFASVPEQVLAVTHGGGYLWVTTQPGSVFKIDATTGRIAGKLALSDGLLQTPGGVAFEPTTKTLWIAETAAYRVRVIRLDGTTSAMLQDVAGAAIAAPLDVAYDAAGGRVLVLVQNAKLDYELVGGESIAAARFVHAFGTNGQYQASFVGRGQSPGQMTRVGGIAAGPNGRFYVSDVFQCTIQVFGSAGEILASLGAAGVDPGELLNPLGLAMMANGDVAVANASDGRVDRFGDGTPPPVCAGDSDCDGLPDAWELAYGLDPHFAGDSLLDHDGDGLNTAEEYAFHTSPRNADSDGDGRSDGVEAYAPTDPNDPRHEAAIVASGPSESPPGLVRLSSVVSGTAVSCRVSWTQKGGPPVALSSATSASPTFIARKAGTYVFDAIAACSDAKSAASRVAVVIDDVAPAADAERVVVVAPGTLVRLDARFSSDANGDPLHFTWEQTLGPAVMAAQSGHVARVSPSDPGRYDFSITVADAAGHASQVDVPVLVTAGTVGKAIAAADPAEAQVGATVQLDATASLVEDPGTAAFAWEQVGGPAAEIIGGSEPVASFVPPAAGRYTFAVSVTSGGVLSPRAMVDVFVAEVGGALPVVTSASAPAVVAVNAPASLEASASGSVTYEWRQVSGPAAGLTKGDEPVATVVPFAPGFHVFDVIARDGAAESRPVRVSFEARAGGRAIPKARISLPSAGDPSVGQLVLLDGRASTGAAHYQWTQTAGPWVALGGSGGVTWFTPQTAGVYAFELEVDDGTARSKPERVEINVVSAGGVQ